jgi:hypothetical protein
LSKEKFWKDSLLQVNKEFLFGCGTPNWWDPETKGRDGIHGGHAYSILRAVEYKNERLLLVKNPWGQGEWNGPWSDGSSQWTAESIKDLGHTFGNDGVFWIPYHQLLRKYHVIWRIRLFGPEWKVTQQWTSLAIPWAGQYQDTKFEVIIAKTAPTVLVLSQLDDRYFRGFEGQYDFRLSFRLHRAGEEDYVIRTISDWDFDLRSVSAELELEAGKYEVFVKIIGRRCEWRDKIENVVKDNWLSRREKLLQIGLSYDLAHAKAQVKEKEGEKVEESPKEQEKSTQTKLEQPLTGSASKSGPIIETTLKSAVPTASASKQGPDASMERSGAAPEADQEPYDEAPVITVKVETQEERPDEAKADKPWGAVCVVGLRVYCRDADATIQIIRPKEEVVNKPKLDVDDPARDASKDADASEGKKDEHEKVEDLKDVTKETKAEKEAEEKKEVGDKKVEASDKKEPVEEKKEETKSENS